MMEDFLVQNPEYLHTIKKPLRYIRQEFGLPENPEKKLNNRECVRWLLVFPDVYEMGASSYGFQLLFWLLNSMDKSIADRFFAPYIDAIIKIERGILPLRSLWLNLSPEEFDIIGFSLSSELQFSTAVKIAELIKKLLKERKGDTIFIAGGPSVVNPAPLYTVFDAFFIGEAEEAVKEINESVREAKLYGSGKRELLKKLSKIPGIYIPLYHGTGEENLPPEARISRRIVSDFENSFAPESQLVPLMDIVHNRIAIEIARGCIHSCRFCLAGYIYRPIRERSIDKIYDLAQKLYKSTGYQEISLLSLSTGDYSQLEEMIDLLYFFCKRNNLILNLPSLRIGSLSTDALRKIASLGKRGFTLAPEAGSESLRKKINKFFTDEEIIESVRKAVELGWKGIKLYFMVGLPGESDEDIVGISKLLKNLKRSLPRYARITAMISPFVPKPHTPFHWFTQDWEDVQKKIKLLKRFMPSSVRLKWHSPYLSQVEEFLSKGNWFSSYALEEAVNKGCYLDTWDECFSPSVWSEVLEKHKDRAICKEGDKGVLPWDFIETGVKKDFLISEQSRFEKAIKTPDCKNTGCTLCGVCNGIDIKVRKSRKEAIKEEFENIEKKEEEPVINLMINFSKTFPANLLKPAEVNSSLTRTLRRAGVKLKHRGQHNPRPKISSTPALPFGMESLDEYIKAEVIENKEDVELIKTILLKNCERGIKIKDIKVVSKEKQSLFEATSGALFRIEFLNKNSFSMFLRQNIQILKDRGVLEKINEKNMQIEVKLKARENKGGLNLFREFEKWGINSNILYEKRILKIKHFF